MTNYGTIKIPEPAYEYHNEQRQELGLTWEQYINSQEPNAREQTIDVEDSRLLAEHVERALSPYFADLAGVDDASKIRDAAKSNDVSEVLGRIDDLENSLPTKVAEEVRR